MTVACLCHGSAANVTLKLTVGRCAAGWEVEVEDGWDGLLFPKSGFTRTGKGLNVRGTFGCALERWRMLLLVLR
jgi:hypothetical protein